MQFKPSISSYVILSLLLAGFGYAADPADAKTIAREIRERGDLSTFRELLEKTDLGARLSERSRSSYSVFAPTNDAFEKLPAGAIETLLDPRNDDRLEEVFGFHVLPQSLAPIFLGNYVLLRMSTGQFVSIDYANGTIADARFTAKAIPCSNGIIYQIDTVLTPTTDDLFQRLQKDGRFTIFARAITASRQGKLFQNMHDVYTVFAPTDEAFGKLPKDMLESLFLPENDERLEDIIKHHIAKGVFASQKTTGAFLSLGVSDVTPISAFGQQLNFKIRDDRPTIDDAAIVQTDLPCANGIIHVIDAVIPPAENSLLDILQQDPRFTTLVSLLEATSLDIPIASSSQFTIFAPVNDAFKNSPYGEWLKDPLANREALYGLLARHVIVGKHISENCVPYEKLRTIHGAPIYLTRSGSDVEVSGVTIFERDKEAFNGLVNAISGVIADPMELPEGDVTTIDAILFVQNTLDAGREIYENGNYESSWRYFTRRGYEFASKYADILGSSGTSGLLTTVRDDQPTAQFAQNAWQSRNAFRNVLRQLEQKEDRIIDSYLMQRPDQKVFGR